ncbi:MAG TPA: Uma2 family endonuclease [Candidatus Baltobacteraceae bacterium]
MGLHEIVLPETKPETEWVRGRALQKMSPTRDHSRLQSALIVHLGAWADGRGEVGVEWQFRLSPPGSIVRPLVPDISYVSNERLRNIAPDELQVPRFPPDVAIEVLSPDDRGPDIEDKISVYLSAGTALVILVDPKTRTAALIDPLIRRTLDETQTLEHAALPGFSLSLATLFATLAPPR